MLVGTYTKQPGERYPFTVSFASRMAQQGDTLASVSATADDPSVTIVQATISGQVAYVWVEGGTHGENYQITLVATTTGGQLLEAEVRVRVREV